MKTKKISALILTLLMLIGCMTTAFASDERTVIDSGTFGSNITWTLYSDKEIVFSGSGEMENVALVDGPWFKIVNGMYGEDTPLVLTFEDGITSILNCCVYPDLYLEAVNIPASVTYIQPGALADPIKVFNIDESNESYKVIDGSVYTYDGKTLLKYGAFNRADDFKIPETVEKIETGAFNFSIFLTNLTIPDNVKVIEEGAFISAYSLKKVVFEGSLEKIPAYSFGNSTSLEEIVFPEGLKTIDKDAFYFCMCLKNIIIPEGVEVIGEEAFYGCVSADTIVIPSSCKELGKSSFEECIAADEMYILSDTLTKDELVNAIVLEFNLHNREKWIEYYSFAALYGRLDCRFSFDDTYTEELYESELLKVLNDFFDSDYETVDEAVNSDIARNYNNLYLTADEDVPPSYLTVYGYPDNSAKAFTDEVGVKYACAHRWSDAACGEVRVCLCGEEEEVVHKDENADGFCDVCAENLQGEEAEESGFSRIINVIKEIFNRILDFFRNLF